jgi:DNA polymerase-3 subunit epsilon
VPSWEDYAGLPLDSVPLAFVDVETTGLRAHTGDRICEIAVVVYRGDEEVLAFDSLVNPCRPISPGAAAVNGLTDAMVSAAPPFGEIAPRVVEALGAGIPVAHNAPFDLSFLAREFVLADLPPCAAGALDTLIISRRLLPFGRHGLAELARALGLPGPEPAHRALADAVTTRALLKRLADLAGGGQSPALSTLLDLQGGLVEWPALGGDSLPPLPPHLADLVKPGERLQITYVGARGERTSRVVEANEIYANGSVLYLVAHCHLRGEQRTFRLDRIVACEPA